MASVDVSSAHTLLNVAKTFNGNEQLDIAKTLHERNGFVRVAQWEEANQLTSHVFSKEKSLPSGSVRGVNEGVGSETPQTEQGVEPLMRIESRSEIDEYIIDDVVPNPREYRYKYDMVHAEGLGQTLVDAFFYYDPADDPNKIEGLAERYADLSLDNVHDAGDTTGNSVMSLWVVQFGSQKCSGLYGRAGIGNAGDTEYSGGAFRMEDKGKQFVYTSVANNKGLYKYVTNFSIVAGLMVADDRATQRLANIATSSGSNEVDPDQVIWLIESLPDAPAGNDTYIFTNRLGKYQLKSNISTKANIYWSDKDEYGMLRDYFYGIPIVTVEGLKKTESVVS